jgi:homoprotocatechuate degradation regulator HpaR
MQEFSRSLPMMLYRSLDVVMPRFRRIFNEFGLTEQQWRVLRVLWEHEQIVFKQLSALALIPPPSLVGVVDRLTKRGLAKRRRADTDRRIVFVYATHKSRAMESKVRPLVDKAYDDLQHSVDPKTWNTLIASLEQISSIDDEAERK